LESGGIGSAGLFIGFAVPAAGKLPHPTGSASELQCEKNLARAATRTVQSKRGACGIFGGSRSGSARQGTACMVRLPGRNPEATAENIEASRLETDRRAMTAAAADGGPGYHPASSSRAMRQ
jgi:hypothetical protein